MGFLNKLMIHLNNATKVALSEGNNTLDKKLYAFLCKMLEADANGKLVCNEIKELNEEVVYFVLNGTDIRNNNRAFVAGMNWANLHKTLLDRTFSEKASLANTNPQNEAGNKTLIYSTNQEDLKSKKEDSRYINRCWNLVWEDYLKLTLEEEKRNLFTLNHWLLNKTKHPLNIGFYWGCESKQKSADGGYFHLPKNTLKKIKAFDVKLESFNPLNLSKDFVGGNKHDNALNKIKTHMDEMDQDNIDLSNLNNIGFTVYHILRSYGCWGGNSFYSIPINYGSAKEKRIGVLSICTKKPLSEKLIERWSLVANKIFKDIILHEIDYFTQLEKKKSFSLTTHSLMTEINTSLKPQLNYIDEEIDKITDPSEKLVNAKEELKRLVQNQSYLAGLNSLIDKIEDIPAFQKSGKKYKLLSDNAETFNLPQYINEFNLKHPSKPDIILANPEIPNLTITVNGLFFSSLLVKLFYDTLFENIVENGTRVNGNNVVLTAKKEGNIWIFENSMPDENHTVNEERLRGNLSLFKTLIEESNSGEFIVKGEDYTFQIIIKPN